MDQKVTVVNLEHKDSLEDQVLKDPRARQAHLVFLAEMDVTALT